MSASWDHEQTLDSNVWAVERNNFSGVNGAAIQSHLTNGQEQRVLPRMMDDAVQSEAPGPRFLLVHRVICDSHDHNKQSDFLDVPRLYTGDTTDRPLRGRQAIFDVEDYLNDHPDIVLVVYRNYSCSEYLNRLDFGTIRTSSASVRPRDSGHARLPTLGSDGPPATSDGEHIVIVSNGLRDALSNLESSDPDVFAGWDRFPNLERPYLHMYHCRQTMQSYVKDHPDDLNAAHIRALLDYIIPELSAEYSAADDLFGKGLVSREHFDKLFAPGQVVIRSTEDSLLAYAIKMCRPTIAAQQLMCYSWEFNGMFRKKDIDFTVEWPASADARLLSHDTMKIAQLTMYPLKYADPLVEQKLKKRGQNVWNCRNRNFVSYGVEANSHFDLQKTKLRYMVDVNTFRQMHADSGSLEPQRNDLGTVESISKSLPADPFVLLLPDTIKGFGFHDKKWRTLLAENVEDVQWDKKAFDRLVLEPDKKEVIRALVSVHIDTIHGADIIPGKGNGLIILLHGPPGTGKTLTAESVAELAEKPLYRVTCGDIGTEPEGVEKYLESVLYIGKIWDCIVLLDEADVFLEERSQMDLQRNALVSVFLRVLEYYDGILILTTNRIGTFDEAFKSRIQIALHYPTLEESERREIWDNCLDMLDDIAENVNMRGLRQKRDSLAAHPLNGRQIRNTVKTARQLAHYRKETLELRHFAQALKIANEFDKYIEQTHGYSDGERARDQGTRY